MLEQKLKERLRYDHKTGKIYWNEVPVTRPYDKTFNIRFANKEAGTIKPLDGYLQIKFEGKFFPAHRLAWFLYYGFWPSNQLDHKDGVRLNNRINNLRDVTHKVNGRNQKRKITNTSGHTGIYFCDRTNKWVSRIKVDGVSIPLGYFSDKNDALKARSDAEKLHGFTESHGRR